MDTKSISMEQTNEKIRGEESRPRWSSQSLASGLCHAIFYTFIRATGRYGGYFLLFWVVGWYTLSPSVRRRSTAYLAHRFPSSGSVVRLLQTWKLQWNFGLCLVDRATAGINGEFTFPVGEAAQLTDILQDGTGLIVLSAHSGCWQLSPGALARSLERPVAVLVHKEEGDVDKQDFEHRQNQPLYQRINADTGSLAALEMALHLQKGGVLCMMGDRSFAASEPATTASFWGEAIPLPITAYRLASVTRSPIAVVFSLRSGPGNGRFIFAGTIDVPEGLGKSVEAYAEAVRQYAEMLEEYTRHYPYQFFNFFNMWE